MLLSFVLILLSGCAENGQTSSEVSESTTSEELQTIEIPEIVDRNYNPYNVDIAADEQCVYYHIENGIYKINPDKDITVTVKAEKNDNAEASTCLLYTSRCV